MTLLALTLAAALAPTALDEARPSTGSGRAGVAFAARGEPVEPRAAAEPCADCHVAGATPRAATALALEALEAIDALDLARAHALLDGAPADGPGLRFARGVLALHEQRYPEAAALLADVRGPGARFLDAAVGGAAATRGHAARAEGRFALTYPAAAAPAIAPLVAALERQASALAAALGAPAPERVPVELVLDRVALARAVALPVDVLARSGTVAAMRFGKLVLVAPEGGRARTEWLDTAAHEYTHLALAVATRDRAPIWLQEGLAGLLEARWRGGAPALSPAALARARHAAERDALVPFAELHPSLALLRADRAALAQAQVVLAAEHLASRGPDVLARIVAALRDGATAEDAIAGVVGAPFPEVLRGLRRHLAARRLPSEAWRTLHELRAQGGQG